MTCCTASGSRRTAPRPRRRSALQLTGDFQLVGGFNLNGIDATPDGKTLVVVQSATGKLFRVVAASGVTKAIDLGGALVSNGDGLLLHGRTLYVVQNRDNKIAVVALAKGLASGRRGASDHEPRIRRADHDRPSGVAHLRRQRAVRHGRPDDAVLS